jgi:hypothetical protein
MDDCHFNYITKLKKKTLQLMVIVKNIYEIFSNVLKGFSSCVIDDVSVLFLTFKMEYIIDH